MKILIGIGFTLFILSFALVCAGGGEGIEFCLTPAAIFGGSSLIALAIYKKK